MSRRRKGPRQPKRNEVITARLNVEERARVMALKEASGRPVSAVVVAALRSFFDDPEALTKLNRGETQ